jgi:hypothetical protein
VGKLHFRARRAPMSLACLCDKPFVVQQRRNEIHRVIGVGRLHVAFWMATFIPDKAFVAEACNIGVRTLQKRSTDDSLKN